jgi:hypothetical protein
MLLQLLLWLVLLPAPAVPLLLQLLLFLPLLQLLLFLLLLQLLLFLQLLQLLLFLLMLLQLLLLCSQLLWLPAAVAPPAPCSLLLLACWPLWLPLLLFLLLLWLQLLIFQCMVLKLNQSACHSGQTWVIIWGNLNCPLAGKTMLIYQKTMASPPFDSAFKCHQSQDLQEPLQ